MHSVFQKWYQRYFSDEEAIVLLILLAASTLVVVFWGHMLAPVFASLVFAFMLQGLVERLEHWGVSHLLAVTLVTLFFVGCFLAALLVVLPLISRQLTLLWGELPNILASGEAYLDRLATEYSQWVSRQQLNQVMDAASSEVGRLGQKLISFSTLRNVFTVLLYVILVPILVFFMLLDRERLTAWMAGLFPERRPLLTQIALEMNEQVANYIRGKAVEIAVVGGVTWVTFELLGVNYAALLAVLVGLSVIIPYIGATAVTLPVAVVGYLQWGWAPELLWLLVAYGVIQLLDGNVLVPLLFSEAVNLHPVVIIVAVLLFGGLWGFWGVFFAIPLATLVKAVFNAWPRHEIEPSPPPALTAPATDTNRTTDEGERA